jgi:tetratricopeptide (TPR) repeat protein
VPTSGPSPTSSPQTQLWFDRGLNWLYGFNHAEAIKCFEKALETDPGCAMAHWGISYAAGPNYNLPWHRYDPAGKKRALEASYDAMQRALAAAPNASPVEQALIAALPARYPQREAIEDQTTWDKAFTVEMRKLFHAHPHDLDLRSVFAEAIMNETPWLMWDLKTGKPTPGAGTEEAVEVLESAFRDIPRELGPSRPAAPLCPPDGDVAVPAARACAPATGCATSCRIPAISCTCRPISTCCAATIVTSSSTTRRRSSWTASTWRARVPSTSIRCTAATTITSSSTARCSSASTRRPSPRRRS